VSTALNQDIKQPQIQNVGAPEGHALVVIQRVARDEAEMYLEMTEILLAKSPSFADT
jgi:hypothetical protein